MSLLEQDITRKKRVVKRMTELEVDNSKEYKEKAIWYNAIYDSESKSDQLPELYYLVE